MTQDMVKSVDLPTFGLPMSATTPDFMLLLYYN